MHLFRKKPSPSMIVAMVALFVALSGGAYASVALNQVRSTHIKDGEVKTADIAGNAVTRAKINNNAINSDKVLNGGLEAVDLSAAAQATLKGQKGDTGAPGTPGAPGPSDAFSARDTAIINMTGGTTATLATLSLPAGSYVIASKMVLENDDPAAVAAVTCNLASGTTTDNQTIRLAVANDTDDREVVSNMITTTLAAAGTATLTCTPPGGNSTIDADDLWVVATKVGTLTHVTL